MARRVAKGDVFQVQTPKGLAYMQFCLKHPEYGETVRVLPGLFQERPELDQVVEQHAYFAFYPVGYAQKQSLIEHAGKFGVPSGLEKPGLLRRAGGMTRDGVVKNWIIEEPTGERLLGSLSEEEKQLSIAELWNHEMLVERLSAQWRPAMEC